MKKEAVFLTENDDGKQDSNDSSFYSGSGDFQFMTNRGRLEMKQFSKWPISSPEDVENFMESIPPGYVEDIVKKADELNFSRFIMRHYEWLLLSIRPLSTPLYSDFYKSVDLVAYATGYYGPMRIYHDFIFRARLNYYNSPRIRERFKKIANYSPQDDKEVEQFTKSTQFGAFVEISNLIPPMKKREDTLAISYMEAVQPMIFALVKLFSHAAIEFSESAMQVMKSTYKRGEYYDDANNNSSRSTGGGQLEKMQNDRLQLGDLPYEILQHILILAAPKNINILEFIDMVHMNVQDKIPAAGCFFLSLEPSTSSSSLDEDKFKLMFYYNDFDFNIEEVVSRKDDGEDFDFASNRKRVDLTPILKIMSFTSAIVYAINEYLKYPNKVRYHLVSTYGKLLGSEKITDDLQWFDQPVSVISAKWYRDATKNVPISSVLSVGRMFSGGRECGNGAGLHLIRPNAVNTGTTVNKVIKGKWNGYAAKKIFSFSGDDDDDDDDDIEEISNKTRNISLIEGKVRFSLAPRRKGRDSPYKKREAIEKKSLVGGTVGGGLASQSTSSSSSFNIYVYKHENMFQSVIYIDQGENKYDETNYDEVTGELKRFQMEQRQGNFNLPAIKNKKKLLYSLRHDIRLVPELSVLGLNVYRDDNDGESSDNYGYGRSPSLSDVIRQFIFPVGDFSKFFEYRICLKKGSYKDVFGDERKLGDPARLTKMKQLEFYPPIMETDISYFDAESFSLGPRVPYEQYNNDPMKTSSLNKKYGGDDDEDIMCGYFMDSEYILRRNYSYKSHFIKAVFNLKKLRNLLRKFDDIQLRNEAKGILVDSLLKSDPNMSRDELESIKADYMNGDYKGMEDLLLRILKYLKRLKYSENKKGLNNILYEYFHENPTSVLDPIEYYISNEFIKNHIDHTVENSLGNIEDSGRLLFSSIRRDYDLYIYRLVGAVVWKMVNKYADIYSPPNQDNKMMTMMATTGEPRVYIEMRLPLVLKLESIYHISKGRDDGMVIYDLEEVKEMIRTSPYIRMSNMFDKMSEGSTPVILTCTTVLVPLEDIKKYIESKTSGNRKNPTFLDLYLLNYQEDLVLSKEERKSKKGEAGEDASIEQMQQEDEEVEGESGDVTPNKIDVSPSYEFNSIFPEGEAFEPAGGITEKITFDVYSHFRVKNRRYLNFMVHPWKEKSQLKKYIEFEHDEDSITTASEDYSPFNDIKIHLFYGEDFESSSKNEGSFYNYIRKISFDEYMKATDAAKQMQKMYNNIAPMWTTALLPSIYFFTENGESLINPAITDTDTMKRKYYTIEGKKLKTPADFEQYKNNFRILMQRVWDPEQYPKIINFPYQKKSNEQTL